MALAKPVVVTRTAAIASGYGLVDGEQRPARGAGRRSRRSRGASKASRRRTVTRSLGSRARRRSRAGSAGSRYVDRLERAAASTQPEHRVHRARQQAEAGAAREVRSRSSGGPQRAHGCTSTNSSLTAYAEPRRRCRAPSRTPRPRCSTLTTTRPSSRRREPGALGEDVRLRLDPLALTSAGPPTSCSAARLHVGGWSACDRRPRTDAACRWSSASRAPRRARPGAPSSPRRAAGTSPRFARGARHSWPPARTRSRFARRARARTPRSSPFCALDDHGGASATP